MEAHGSIGIAASLAKCPCLHLVCALLLMPSLFQFHF